MNQAPLYICTAVRELPRYRDKTLPPHCQAAPSGHWSAVSLHLHTFPNISSTPEREKGGGKREKKGGKRGRMTKLQPLGTAFSRSTMKRLGCVWTNHGNRNKEERKKKIDLTKGKKSTPPQRSASCLVSRAGVWTSSGMYACSTVPNIPVTGYLCRSVTAASHKPRLVEAGYLQWFQLKTYLEFPRPLIFINMSWTGNYHFTSLRVRKIQIMRLKKCYLEMWLAWCFKYIAH